VERGLLLFVEGRLGRLGFREGEGEVVDSKALFKGVFQ
jgi:hypothetical protein